MTNRNYSEVQKLVYPRVINMILQKEGISFGSFEDAKDGIKIPRLVEILVGQKIPGWKPNPVFLQKQENVKVITDYLAKNDRAFSITFNINVEADTLGLLWLILNKLYIKRPLKELISIYSQLLDSYKDLSIGNMGNCWAFGLPFLALANKLSNGTIPYQNYGTANYNKIKEACEKLNIPFILEPGNICEYPCPNCITLQAQYFLEKFGDNLPDPNAKPKTTQNLFIAPMPDQNYADQLKNRIVNQTSSQKPAPAPAPAQPVATPTGKGLDGTNDRIAMRSNEYTQYASEAIMVIEAEEKKIETSWLNRSVPGVHALNGAITEYGRSGNKACRDSLARAKPVWEAVINLSRKAGLQVPQTIVQFPKLNERLAALDKRVSELRAGIDKDKVEMEKWQQKVDAVKDLESARKLFDEFPFPKDNWHTNAVTSIQYQLGTKIESLEDALNTKKRSFIETYKAKCENVRSEVSQIRAILAKKDWKEVKESAFKIDALEQSLPSIDAALKRAREENGEVPAEDLASLIRAVKEERESAVPGAYKKHCGDVLEDLREFIDGARSVLKEVAENDTYENISRLVREREVSKAEGRFVKHCKKSASLKDAFPEEEGRKIVSSYMNDLNQFLHAHAAKCDAVGELRQAVHRLQKDTVELGRPDDDSALPFLKAADSTLEEVRRAAGAAAVPAEVKEELRATIADCGGKIEAERARLVVNLRPLLEQLRDAVANVGQTLKESQNDVSAMRNAGGVCKRWAERQRSVLERQAYLGIEGFSPEADAKALQEALYKINLALN